MSNDFSDIKRMSVLPRTPASASFDLLVLAKQILAETSEGHPDKVTFDLRPFSVHEGKLNGGQHYASDLERAHEINIESQPGNTENGALGEQFGYREHLDEEATHNGVDAHVLDGLAIELGKLPAIWTLSPNQWHHDEVVLLNPAIRGLFDALPESVLLKSGRLNATGAATSDHTTAGAGHAHSADPARSVETAAYSADSGHASSLHADRSVQVTATLPHPPISDGMTGTSDRTGSEASADVHSTMQASSLSLGPPSVTVGSHGPLLSTFDAAASPASDDSAMTVQAGVHGGVSISDSGATTTLGAGGLGEAPGSESTLTDSVSSSLLSSSASETNSASEPFQKVLDHSASIVPHEVTVAEGQVATADGAQHDLQGALPPGQAADAHPDPTATVSPSPDAPPPTADGAQHDLQGALPPGQAADAHPDPTATVSPSPDAPPPTADGAQHDLTSIHTLTYGYDQMLNYPSPSAGPDPAIAQATLRLLGMMAQASPAVLHSPQQFPHDSTFDDRSAVILADHSSHPNDPSLSSDAHLNGAHAVDFVHNPQIDVTLGHAADHHW